MVWLLQDGDTYTRRIGGKDQQGIRINQSSLLSMEELFRYYLENIIILRIGTGLRYLWLRFVRHRKISYRTLYEGSKSKKATELSNFENEMSNRAWGCGFILFVLFLIPNEEGKRILRSLVAYMQARTRCMASLI